MVNLNQLRSFYMAAKFGSITIAAEKLFVSPPAVTMQIKKLEKWLGHPLLIKENNSFKIRKEARELYAYAETIFSTVEELELYLDKQTESKKNELILGTHHIVARFIVPQLVSHLKKAHPGIRIRIILGSMPDLIKKLKNSEVQCVLLASTPRHDKILTIPLFVEDIILVAAKESKFIRNWQIKPKELSGLPLLMLQHNTNIYRIINKFLERNSISPNIYMDNLSGDVVLGFLLQDAGVAFSLRFIMQESIDKGLLREIEVIGGLPKANFGLAFLHENCETPLLRSLVSWFENTKIERSELI